MLDSQKSSHDSLEEDKESQDISIIMSQEEKRLKHKKNGLRLQMIFGFLTSMSKT
jgi:hypothetical protein